MDSSGSVLGIDDTNIAPIVRNEDESNNNPDIHSYIGRDQTNNKRPIEMQKTSTKACVVSQNN